MNDERPGPAPEAGHQHDESHGLPGHRHPHPPDDPSGHPRIGFVGAGRVGCALGVAFANAGWPVAAVASRDSAHLERFVSLMPGARVAASAATITEDVDLVFVTVPDDALADMAQRLRLYAGQAAVHTSGALGADVLEPARAAGAAIGSFHPLVAFADLEAGLAALPGATVALEGSEELVALLAELASDIGCQPVRLPPGGKQAYHAAAVLAAGGFVALLDAIAEAARGAGLDEAGALAIYAPLMRGSLANAERIGVEAALTGPFVRGDEGTIRGHLAALSRLAPGALPVYRALARRELAMALHRGDLGAEQAAALRRLLEG